MRWRIDGLFIGEIRITSCYDQDSRQEDIFEQDVRPLIDVVYSGVVRLLTYLPNG
jgi:hypothetical protein